MNTEILSPWRTDDPPRDGSLIVALGNLTEDDGDGEFTVEPFTESVYWLEGLGWMNPQGLTLTHWHDAVVTIHHWLPQPTTHHEVLSQSN